MHTIIPAPKVVYRVKEMTPIQSHLAAEAYQLAKDTMAFIATIVFVCAMIALCIMIKIPS
ncbi:hypothetical protein HJB53_30320 [Rhizobium lentis]|uniref:hypothetical protein n=1 Tax=Rhizobium lentis TaxID=1138194 RepID=UPI001C83985C|nr:hypothetical protein [Rhizobium lentis]MBX5130788.1 hypothetical protein [Rhizobium lentis]